MAGRLTRTLAGIAVALFSFASLIFIALTRAVAGDVGSAAGEIRLAVAEGRSTLHWIGFVDTSAPVGGVLQVAVPTLMALTFVAALVFFFHQRRTLATTR